MVSAFETKLNAKALAIIQKLGIDTVFTVKAQVYDESTGITAEVETDHTVKSSPPLRYKDYLVDGDHILSTDTFVYVAGTGIPFTPVAGVGVNIGGRDLTVIDVMELRAGTSVAAYKLKLRK